MTMEFYTYREGKQGTTPLGKEEMLRHESFPPNDSDQYYELPLAGCAYTRVTGQAVERALYSQLAKKALGLGKRSAGVIRLLSKWDTESIVRLTSAAICMGRHPAVWTQANVVVIRSPGKDDYTKLKAYNSRPLLSWMGEGVEKAAVELLSDGADRSWLTSPTQCGSRIGQ